MAPDRPDVSVVIPTRNRGSLVNRSLATALAQIDVEVEVVVVDDGSDESLRPHVADLDPRVRMVRRARPGGIAAARNAGVQTATAEWIAFLDDDDLWAPRKLSAQLRVAENVDFSWTGGMVVDPGGEIVEVFAARSPEVVARDLPRYNAIMAGGSNVMARRRLLLDEPFDEALSHLADWDLWLRLSRRGTMAACDETLMAYVRHGDNMHLQDIAGAVPEYGRFRSNHSSAIRDRDALLFWIWVAESCALAGRHRAAGRYSLRAARVARSLSDAMSIARHAAWMTRRRGRRPSSGQRPPEWLSRQLAHPQVSR